MTAGTGLRIMTGLAVASAATLLVLVVREIDRGPPPGDATGNVVRVGVVEGQSVPGYVSGSRHELTALARVPAGPPTWALVSLTGYVAPDRLAPLLTGAAVAQVYTRAPLPGTRTQVVRIPAYRLPGDLVAGMLAAATHRDQEQADYRRLGGELTGAAPNTVRLRTAYQNAASTAAAEAHAYRAHCACVFAAVVRGSPAALRTIADRAGVRAVDPAPEVRALDRAEFRPPLPEDTRSATTSAPAGISPVAPETPAPLPSSSGAPVTSASSDDPAAGSGPSATASEERSAVPSAPAPTPVPDVPSPGPGASRGRSGR